MEEQKPIYLPQIDELRDILPTSPEWLYKFIQSFFGFSIPRQVICKGHSSPFDYICGEFFSEEGPAWTQEEKDRYQLIEDVVVWACRGGLKTLSAAVLSLLDCKFREMCGVRALGGSLEQSNKMYGYFVNMIEKIAASDIVGDPTKTQTKFINGSAMEILTQSEKSVRGTHVPRVRCDEAEDFKREVWQAVQFITSSVPGVKSSFEVLSTMHKAYGRMCEIVDAAEERGTTVLKWCLWEVIERCPRERDCEGCKSVVSYDEAGNQHTFYSICQGKAKLVEEERFPCVLLDDAHKIFKRSKFEEFDAEMLCNRPTAGAGRFYKVYDDRLNVGHIVPNFYEKEWPLYIACDGGFNSPCILIAQENPATNQIYIIDEYRPVEVAPATLVKGFFEFMEERGYKMPEIAICDPAASDLISEFGRVTEEHPRLLVKSCDNDKVDGAAAVRGKLLINEKLGAPMVFICERCVTGRKEMRELHFPTVAASKEASEWHVKKNDHFPDCFRYLLLHLSSKNKIRIRTL